MAAALLALLHVRSNRGKHSAVLSAVVVASVLVIGVASAVQTYRIGDSGARSVWTETMNPAPADGG